MVFSPVNQTVLLKNSKGDTIPFLLSDFDEFSLSRAQTSMIFSAQCAMSLLLAIVLILTSKREKRKTLLFFLNIGGLITVFIRACLQCAYLSGTWVSYSVQFLGEFELLSQKDFYVSIIASCIPIFIILFIELSLLIQIRVVYATEKKLQIPLTIAFSIIIIVVIIFWILAAVQNSMAVLSQTHFGHSGLWGSPWPYTVARISFAFSIFIGCMVFIYKLLITIYRRHKMGVKEFGPLQIIFIMSCQTLIIPAILILVDFGVKITGFSSLTQALVVMSLPLSSLWASSKVENNKNNAAPTYYKDMKSIGDYSIESTPSSFTKPPYMGFRKPSYFSEYSRSPFYEEYFDDNGSKLIY
uniref:Pheromone receptor alpha n=1 Tax=Pneumocystis carinii TaxID=4754 RepID=A2TJ26_PNECA|nr:pheromone receptor alpha [Pneumocystis carinii]